MATMKRALHAKEKIREILRDLPGINGIGVTWDDKGQPCVRVNIDFEIKESDRKKIPSLIEGVPVLVEVVGQAQME
jgi:hypothetical protein